MTTTNVLGIRNNNTIIPLTATTKETKWLDLVLTTDITCPQTGFAVTKCRAKFSADSAGKWAMEINLDASFTSATVSSIVLTFPNIAFSSVMTGAISGGWGGTVVAVRALASGSTITADSSSTNSVSGLILSGTLQLDSNPTTYTTAANMEGVVAVDVFVPSAAAGIQGLVDNRVANTGGTPILGKTAAGAVAAGYVGEELESIATVATNTSGYSFNVASKALTAGTWLVSGHVIAIMKTSFAVFQGAIGTTSETGDDIRASGQHMGGTSNGEYRSCQLCPKIVNTTGATIYLNSICIGASDCSVIGILNCVRIA